MIPYAIMCGQLHTENGKQLDIRMLELLPDGFTFRLPKGYLEENGEATELEISFYLREQSKYITHRLVIDNTVASIRALESEEYYEVYEFTSSDTEYRVLSAALTGEYLYYIDCKLTLSDEELSAAMTGNDKGQGYPSDREDIFVTDSAESKLKWGAQIMSEIAAAKNASDNREKDSKLCYSLESRELVDMYLKMHIGELVMSVCKSYGMEKHPFASAKIHRLYVGNPYCCNLRLPIDTISRVCEKAALEGLGLTIVLAPVPESCYEDYCGYVEELEAVLGRNMSVDAELSVNDEGMYRYISEKFPKRRVITGVLMNKCRRDPRSKYLTDIREEGCSEQYYPFYQTNTGTFCPLYAAVVNGARGNQERVTECSRLCEQNRFVYPEHLNMIGRYNSIFGVNTGGVDINADRVVIDL